MKTFEQLKALSFLLKEPTWKLKMRTTMWSQKHLMEHIEKVHQFVATVVVLKIQVLEVEELFVRVEQLKAVY